MYNRMKSEPSENYSIEVDVKDLLNDSHYCPCCKQEQAWRQWIKCWWHHYEFRHLLRDFGSNNQRPYWRLGKKLSELGLLDYHDDDSIERNSREEALCINKELHGIVKHMNGNVKIYQPNGIHGPTNPNKNKRFSQLKEQILKNYEVTV